MIKRGILLEYKKAMLGLRVYLNDGTVYDIPMDFCKRFKNFTTEGFESEKLVAKGDLLLTKGEIATRHHVPAYTENPHVAGLLHEFFDKADDRIKRKEQLERAKLWSAFENVVPRQQKDEFLDFVIANKKAKKNHYSTFTPQQRETIKDYYRWRSRTIFYENKATNVIMFKRKKTKELVSLMGIADDWVYDGSVDTGEFGGHFCALGHPLRYQHFAFSATLSKSIVFGSTCVADFFEVDKSTMNDIAKAQERLTKELTYINFLNQSKYLDEYMQKYTNVWDVLKFFKGNFTKLLENGSGWAAMLGGFAKAKIPFTASLMYKYNNLNREYNTANKLEEEHKKATGVVPTSTTVVPTVSNDPTKGFKVEFDENTKLLHFDPTLITDYQTSPAKHRAIDQLLRFATILGFIKNPFGRKVLETVLKTGNMTERQKEYVQKDIDALTKAHKALHPDYSFQEKNAVISQVKNDNWVSSSTSVVATDDF